MLLVGFLLNLVQKPVYSTLYALAGHDGEIVRPQCDLSTVKPGGATSTPTLTLSFSLLVVICVLSLTPRLLATPVALALASTHGRRILVPGQVKGPGGASEG